MKLKDKEFKYRKLINAKGLVRSAVIEKDTDLLILADKAMTSNSLEALKKELAELEYFISKNSNFETTLKPMNVSMFSPKIVRLMSWAAKKANVGPMAAMAGAIAEQVGRSLMKSSKELIVENGGDIFLKTIKPRRIGVYAGKSPFSEKIAIEINPDDTPLGICTSAGTSGHNIPLGNADAVVVTASSAALADAAATAIGNLVKNEETIVDGLDQAKMIKGLHGVLIIKNDKMGAWGTLKIVSI